MLVGGLVLGLGVAAPAGAQEVHQAALVWPSPASSSAAAEADRASILEAFGAEPDRARDIAALDLAAGGTVPDSLSGEQPVRSERASNDALQAEVQVYEDGSANLTFIQLDTIDVAADSLVAFDSATIDISPILRDVAATRDSESGDSDEGGFQPLASTTISGCNTLPNQNGWTRRADCLIYSTSAIRDISGSFRFDYAVKSGGGRIDTVYGPDRRCTGSASGTLSIDRPINVGSNPALATHTIVCGVGPVSVTWNQTLYAYGSVWGSFE